MRRLIGIALGSLAVSIGCSSSSGPGETVTVTQVVPSTAATDVALSSDVVLSFSEALNPASVTSSTIRLTYKGIAAPSTLALENGDKDVRLTPGGTLGNNRTYKIEVTTGVKSASGISATAFASTFKTLTASANIADAAGDTFGVDAGQPDVASLSATQWSSLTIVLTFHNAISPWLAGALTSVGGYIDIDADQNTLTGFESASDYYRPASDAGVSGLGDEYIVSLFQNANGSFTVYDANDSLGTVMPTYDAQSITMTIPLTLLGNDDGNMNLGALIGSPNEPTDIVPSDGHLTLGDPGVPAPPISAALVAAKRPLLPHRWNR